MPEPTQTATSATSPTSAISLLLPLPGRVVLRRTELAAAPSPYVIPDQAKEKPVEAVVVAIPTVPTYEYGILIPCPLSIGDKVLVGRYAGDHKFRGEDATIVRWDEVLAIISEPAASAKEVDPSTREREGIDWDALKVDQSQSQSQSDRRVPRL